jgi:hypothetical protein
MNKLSKLLCIAALAGPLALPALAQYAPQAPPPPVAEAPGPVPYAGAVWVPGYHRWERGAYVWVPGHYERPRRPGAVWIPGHWKQTPRGWVWRPGHWRY